MDEGEEGIREVEQPGRELLPERSRSRRTGSRSRPSTPLVLGSREILLNVHQNDWTFSGSTGSRVVFNVDEGTGGEEGDGLWEGGKATG